MLAILCSTQRLNPPNQRIADISPQLKPFTDIARFSSAMALAKLAGLVIFSSVFIQ
ncbi:MAG TPA: hypothetical protein VLG17_23995 [Pseudomonas sp.]|uniref:hypothetical protein n=1 Tax=Pseudomonas sp. TaxID=306 RepID=UPI002C758B81|nr:hypothetical protein [Pseudomonas sp.]HSX91049.1 hypothetical protein [Pseudomonas sp.]